MPVISVEQALEIRKGRKLVFTNGVFDILHLGHVRYLEAARELGDMLIVGMNSDESVRRLGKGPDRPINSFSDRAGVLAALRCVDQVVEFVDDTPEGLLARLKPEVHVKGGDYREDDLPEAGMVREYGGSVVIIPLVPGRSTTALVRKLRI